ncbi:MAG: hypothetical protein M3459_06915 [Actinomycetota bacterium]|nr:hypothetical protein [Actinomycetota bacterium]
MGYLFVCTRGRLPVEDPDETGGDAMYEVHEGPAGHAQPGAVTGVRAVLGALLGAAALAVMACGGEGETSTVTVTAPAPPPAAGDDAPANEGAPAEMAPTERALPEGVVAADGKYVMEVADVASGTLLQDEGLDGATTWSFATECAGGRCTVQMRREFDDSGGTKSVTLEPAANRPGVYEGESTGGPVKCLFGGGERPTEQRYSIRLYEPTDVGGRPTATRMDAYLIDEVDAVDGCKEGKADRGTIRWTGTRGG